MSRKKLHGDGQGEDWVLLPRAWVPKDYHDWLAALPGASFAEKVRGLILSCMLHEIRASKEQSTKEKK